MTAAGPNGATWSVLLLRKDNFKCISESQQTGKRYAYVPVSPPVHNHEKISIYTRYGLHDPTSY